MTEAYEQMVTERMATYNTSRQVVERAAKAFWTSNAEDDQAAYADSLEVRTAIGGNSFTLDDYLRYFAAKETQRSLVPQFLTFTPDTNTPAITNNPELAATFQTTDKAAYAAAQLDNCNFPHDLIPEVDSTLKYRLRIINSEPDDCGIR